MGEDIGGEELFFEVGEVGAVFFVRAADDVLEDGEEAFEFEGVGVFQGAAGGAVGVAVVTEATAFSVITASCGVGDEDAVVDGLVVFGGDVRGEEEKLREFWDVKV